MPTEKRINDLKNQFGHAFEVDNKGNMVLKAHYGIPRFKLIYVEGGEFTMGDGKHDNEPKHKVELSSFFIAEYPVTQEIYKEVVTENKTPSRFEGINHPVERVSWVDAVNFCNLLNKKLGFEKICDKDYNFLDKNGNKTKNITDVKGFRLPTEAEWEFAARGGDPAGFKNPPGLEYAGSNNLDEVGWYEGNNGYETKPVGLKFPNALEIYDMSGNVWEWCWDWYDDKFYEKSIGKNPVNMKTGAVRVLRGGSWFNYAVNCRVAYRYFITPDGGYDYGGFRLVFAL